MRYIYYSTHIQNSFNFVTLIIADFVQKMSYKYDEVQQYYLFSMLSKVSFYLFEF